MKIVGFKHFVRGSHVIFYLLPSLSIFRATYIVEIQFSWLLWSVEWTIWESEDG